MPVRLIKQYKDQAANTMYWGSDESELLSLQVADTQIQLASDYQEQGRIVTASIANTNRNATYYQMNSAAPQTLTVNVNGGWLPGTVLTVVQQGAGAFTLAAGAGVTINTAAASLVSKGQYNVCQLVKGFNETWIAVGGIG